jgi:hypothetical protein
MLGNDTVVLDGHLPARERDHPSAKGYVPLEERSSLKRLRHPSDANEQLLKTGPQRRGSAATTLTINRRRAPLTADHDQS